MRNIVLTYTIYSLRQRNIDPLYRAPQVGSRSTQFKLFNMEMVAMKLQLHAIRMRFYNTKKRYKIEMNGLAFFFFINFIQRPISYC